MNIFFLQQILTFSDYLATGESFAEMSDRLRPLLGSCVDLNKVSCQLVSLYFFTVTTSAAYLGFANCMPSGCQLRILGLANCMAPCWPSSHCYVPASNCKLLQCTAVCQQVIITNTIICQYAGPWPLTCVDGLARLSTVHVAAG